MKIIEVMLKKENMILVDINDSIKEAIEKLESGNFLSLPVVDGDDFKGVIFADYIYKNYFDANIKDKNDYLNNSLVRDVYHAKGEFISELSELEEANAILMKNKKTFLPVFNKDEKFTGILTHSAIFEHLYDISGTESDNQLRVIIHNMKGQLSRLMSLTKGIDVNIKSLILEDVKVMNFQRVIMTVEGNDIDIFKDKIFKAGFKIG